MTEWTTMLTVKAKPRFSKCFGAWSNVSQWAITQLPKALTLSSLMWMFNARSTNKLPVTTRACHAVTHWLPAYKMHSGFNVISAMQHCMIERKDAKSSKMPLGYRSDNMLSGHVSQI